MESLIEGYNYLLFFLIWLASTLLLRSIFSKPKPKLRLPPSPLALPIIGHFHLLRSPLHRTLQKLSNRYGPFFHLYLGSRPCVVVSSAEIAKEILKTNEISFCNRPPNAAINYLTYNAADLAYSPYGTHWKFMKKLWMSELLNSRMLDQLLPIRQEEVNQFLQVMARKAEVGEGVNVGAELMRLANSVLMRMAISKSCFNGKEEDEANEVAGRVKESFNICGRFNLSDYFRVLEKLDLQGFGKRLKQIRDRMDANFESIIREHEQERTKSTTKDAPRDMLDVLLTVSEDQSSEVQITRDNIKGFMGDIMSGGTGTMAVGIEWAVAELINHPSVMEKARKEIDSVVGKERTVKEWDIAKLPYLQAIVKETLRLHPPGPMVTRESTETCSIAGYDIPANTQVLINVWALGRDPEFWDDPLEFKPERFWNDESGNKRELDVRGQHYHLLPFGSGRRGCPGTSLALSVFHTTLASMIQCFEWKPVDGCVDMQEGQSVHLQRVNPLICVPKLRLSPFPSM